MTPRPTLNITQQLNDYVRAHSTLPDEVQQSLIEETARSTGGAVTMQISPDEGLFLTFIARLLGARNAVEVGTFTGYSSLSIAKGLADGGKLLCCDVSEEWTSIARAHWDKAGVSDRIDLRIAPAIETLSALPQEPTIDLAFIDADKESYIEYWEALVPRMRQGGVILVDNTLWSARVIDPDPDETTQAIKRFNAHAAADSRVDLVVLTLSDGVTMAVKK